MTTRRKILVVEEGGVDLAHQTELDYNADNQFFDNTSATDFESDSTFDAIREGSFKTQNVVIVKKNPGPTHFDKIETALASITDSSASNPYVILIGPGVYTVDNSAGPVALKPGVTIKPHGHSTVIIEPSTPANGLFVIDEENCRLQGVTIRNVTGGIGIHVENTPTPAVLDFITMSNCQRPIVVESSTSLTQAVFRNLRLISGSTTTKLLSVIAGGFGSIVRIYSAILTDDDGTAFENAIFVTGAGARIDPNTSLIRSTTGAGNGVEIDDGAHFELTAGAEIHGFNNNLVFANSGAAPNASIQGLALHEGATLDLSIVHTGTTGTFGGVARRAKVANAAPTTFHLSYSDPDNANFVNSGMLITRGLAPERNVIVTDGTVHTLTRFSAHATEFTGSTTGTILRLPDATTFGLTGHLYEIWNFSTVSVDIQDSTNSLLATIKPNGHTLIILRDNGTAAGSWGITYTLDSGNVFGSSLFYNDALAETSTTSDTIWSRKLTLTTESLPEGDYMVQFQFLVRSSANGREADIQILNGATAIETFISYIPDSAETKLVSGFIRQTNLSGIQNIHLEFRRGAQNTTIYMQRAKMFIWRTS